MINCTATSRRTALRWLGAGAGTLALNMASPALADIASPIKVVIAFPPGGTSTASMRPLQEPLSAALGAPVELDYRPGAGGNVATLHVAQARPDGFTLLFGHAGPLAINHHIIVQSAFDPLRDLLPLTMVVRFPIVISVAAKHGVGALPDLITLGRRQRLILGSSGNGSIQHLAGEIFCRTAGIETVHIPFAGGGPLQQAFERGAIDLLLETGSNVIKHVRAGTLRALAIMGASRIAMLPDAPTLAEAGMPGLEVSAWFGLLAPTRTPPDVCGRISGATFAALAREDVRSAFEAIGGIPAPMPPAEFASFIAAENVRWGKVIREVGVSPLGAGSGGAIGTPR